eukprot:4889418-Prorocentrum_lima.AAC.1
MTSSLVGSEMCIRDSVVAVAGAVAAAAVAAAVVVVVVAAAVVAVVVGVVAVSYTHLTLPTICSV